RLFRSTFRRSLIGNRRGANWRYRFSDRRFAALTRSAQWRNLQRSSVKSALGPAAQRPAFPKALHRGTERKLTTTRYVGAGKITRFMSPRRQIRPPRQTRTSMKTAVLLGAAALSCVPCVTAVQSADERLRAIYTDEWKWRLEQFPGLEGVEKPVPDR